MPGRSTFHGLTWLVWAVAATVAVSLVSNPLISASVFAIAVAIVRVHGGDGPYRRAFRVLVGIGIVFAGIRVVLTALTTHGGGSTWFTMPAFTLPGYLGGFVVGGTIEGPVILQSLNEGLTIVTIMAVFGAFNACAAHHEILERTPRAFHELGLILTIGLAYVPATIEAVRDVRLADRARTGGQRGGRRRLTRLIVPVLATGLERALALSESMDARGFGARRATPTERTSGIVAIVGTCALVGSVLALVASASWVAVGLAVTGTIAVAIAVGLASRTSGRTRYRPRTLTRGDAVVIVTALLAPVTLGIARLAGEPSLTWIPEPAAWPLVAPVPIVALGLLLAPIIPVAWPTPTSARVRATAATT